MDDLFLDLLAANDEHAATFGARFDDVQNAQHPGAVTVCCADSRVLQDHIWNNEYPGAMFTCANIGNRVVQRTDDGTVVSGDVLYPLVHTDTGIAVVVGHTGCGAITAAYDDITDGISEPAGIAHCLDLLKLSLEPGIEALPDDIDRADAINRLVEYNVDQQVRRLRESDDVPAGTDVVGVVYDFQDVYSDRRGRVHVVNIDGERSVDQLRETYPEISDRIVRLWAY